MLGLAIGDASGHGLPAALLVRDVVTGLRMGIEKELKIAHVFAKLNRVIHRSNLSSRFITVFYGELEANGNLIYVNAGHQPPILFFANPAQVPNHMELDTGGTVIGPLPEPTFRRGFARVRPGEILVAVTDGILERRDADGEFFGAGTAEGAGERGPRALRGRRCSSGSSPRPRPSGPAGPLGGRRDGGGGEEAGGRLEPTAARRSCVPPDGSRPPAPERPAERPEPSASPRPGPRPALPRRPRGRAIPARRVRGQRRCAGSSPARAWGPSWCRRRPASNGVRSPALEWPKTRRCASTLPDEKMQASRPSALPSPEGRGDVRVDGGHERARAEPLLPDPALERLEGGGLAVALHEPEQVGGGGREAIALIPGGRRVRRALAPMLFAKTLEVLADRGMGSVVAQEGREAIAGEGKEGAGDELDRCGRPFDVEKHRAERADAVLRGRIGHPAAACPAIWLGPRQTGSKPRSTPLSV